MTTPDVAAWIDEMIDRGAVYFNYYGNGFGVDVEPFIDALDASGEWLDALIGVDDHVSWGPCEQLQALEIFPPHTTYAMEVKR